MSAPRTNLRTAGVAIRSMLVLTAVLGVGYPLVITGIGQLALPVQSNGTVVSADGEVIGSALIGQTFSDPEGSPLAEWFQPRPSAAGGGYDAGASGGSNLGPENPDLIDAIAERRRQVAKLNGVDIDDVPADAVTASSSGLDPHISPEYALLQVPRVAAERGLPDGDVRSLVEANIQGRDLGYLGEPTVNVLQLNVALAALKG